MVVVIKILEGCGVDDEDVCVEQVCVYTCVDVFAQDLSQGKARHDDKEPPEGALVDLEHLACVR